MSLTQRLIQQSVAPSMLDRALAVLGQRHAGKVYTETEHRARMRHLMDGAGLTGAEVKLAFFKHTDGAERFMLCRVKPGADPTARYVTVVDLELTEQAGHDVYRRVNLDTVSSIVITYHASECTAA